MPLEPKIPYTPPTQNGIGPDSKRPEAEKISLDFLREYHKDWGLGKGAFYIPKEVSKARDIIGLKRFEEICKQVENEDT